MSLLEGIPDPDVNPGGFVKNLKKHRTVNEVRLGPRVIPIIEECNAHSLKAGSSIREENRGYTEIREGCVSNKIG